MVARTAAAVAAVALLLSPLTALAGGPETTDEPVLETTQVETADRGSDLQEPSREGYEDHETDRAKDRLQDRQTDRVTDRVTDRTEIRPTDEPPVKRIEHFIRSHHWLARWISTLPCEVDPCVPGRIQHWFRTHPVAAHWIFWYIRTYVY